MTELPDKMKAMVLTGHGGLDRLEYRDDWPLPVIGDGEALVRVAACGLNNTDINTRTAWYSKGVGEGTHADGARDGFAAGGAEDGSWGGASIAFPRIQGADVCGHVVRVGASAPAGLLGRRVLIDVWLRDWHDPLNLDKAVFFGSECDGGYAEYTKAPIRNVHPVDSALGDAELATFATSYVTAENMLRRASVREGDTVLVTGASGGVGSALLQLVRRRGAVPIAMSSASKARALEAIGAEAVIDRSPASLSDALVRAVGRATVHVVADVVGGPVWPQLIDALARGGRYTCSGAIAGPLVTMDLRSFYLKDLTMTGATVVPPGLFADLVGYIERGEVRPLLAGTWPLAQLRDAQAAFLEKKHVGSLVVTP